jgi:hypothetical protein
MKGTNYLSAILSDDGAALVMMSMLMEMILWMMESGGT